MHKSHNILLIHRVYYNFTIFSYHIEKILIFFILIYNHGVIKVVTDEVCTSYM